MKCVTDKFSFVTDLCSVSRPPVKHLIFRFSVDENGAHTESACKCKDDTACGMLYNNIVTKRQAALN